MRKFYCQDCGTEVPLESNSCPTCNKKFGSVLCPKCNHSGSAITFVDGCPQCGYLKERPLTRRHFHLSFKIFIMLFSLLTITILLLMSFF